MVAAIDFGTSYSGWAFSFVSDYEKDPTAVSIKQWPSDNIVSEKAPTTILIDPDGKTFKAFGYEAENKYSELTEKGQHKTWFYFRRFKMLLMDRIVLKRNSEIEDETGKKLPAKTVFSAAIKYMTDDLLRECSNRIAKGVRHEEIKWVLTVPAIWKDSAKQFMREAAIEAGIQSDQLKIALEPEAASLFCRHVPIERMLEKTSISSMPEESTYMVLDAGGGTVDITVHKILEGGKLKEVSQSSGGAWGGTLVDDAYVQFLISIVGDHVFQRFVTNNMEDYIWIIHEFENKKRTICPKIQEDQKDKTKITLKFPVDLNKTFYEQTGKTLADSLKEMKFSKKVELLKDKIRIDVEIMRNFFETATCSIVEHVKMLFKKPEMEDVNVIIMVGGFSDSKILQNAIRKNFPDKKMVVPSEAGISILKGAVIFGHNPCAISERIAKCTYGMAVRKPFVKGQHDERYKTVSKDGCLLSRGMFATLVAIGQSLKCDGSLKIECVAPDSQAKRSVVRFFATLNKSPKYITDIDCFKIGEMILNIDTSIPYNDRIFSIALYFGDTEIHAKAFEKSTGRETICLFNFLQ